MTPTPVKRTYTKIRKQYDELSRPVWVLYLVIDHQSFAMERSSKRDRAVWYRDQLTTALTRLLSRLAAPQPKKP